MESNKGPDDLCNPGFAFSSFMHVVGEKKCSLQQKDWSAKKFFEMGECRPEVILLFTGKNQYVRDVFKDQNSGRVIVSKVILKRYAQTMLLIYTSIYSLFIGYW